jgi:ferredoxin
MPYVVTDNCSQCRFTDCVSVCPVDCFHGDADMLYIAPNDCIDCGACEPQCPVKAIYEERQLPADTAQWTAINAEKAVGLPVVNQKGTPLPTAEARKKALGL